MDYIEKEYTIQTITEETKKKVVKLYPERSRNRQLRKMTKTKSAFVSDDDLMKILYLATMNIVDKWTIPIRDWGLILESLMIYFGDRNRISP